MNNSDRINLEEGKMLPLVEEFFSIQGEGYHAGKAAYFIRIGGCDVSCSWCDTKFSWDPELHPLVDADEIVCNAMKTKARSVVVTGGEPLKYNMDYLCSELKKQGFQTFVETSGAYPFSGDWDWICLSPKRNTPPIADFYERADELKVIIQTVSDFFWAEENAAHTGMNCRLFLQPEWSRFERIIPGIIGYVKKNPEWNISLQMHKFMHIP